VASGIRPRSIDGFLFGLKLTFQPGQAANLNAVYHFTFTGQEEKQATVTIRDGTLQVQDGHQGEADHRPRERGEEDREQHLLPPEECPQHRRELPVTLAQPFHPSQPPVDEGDEGEGEVAGGGGQGAAQRRSRASSSLSASPRKR